MRDIYVGNSKYKRKKPIKFKKFENEIGIGSVIALATALGAIAGFCASLFV